MGCQFFHTVGGGAQTEARGAAGGEWIADFVGFGNPEDVLEKLKFLIMANPARGRHPWYQINFSEAWEMNLDVFEDLYRTQWDSLMGMYARMKAKGR